MRNIVYHVAISADGFIAREDGSIEGFLMEGPHADEYLEHLKSYDTVLMGRKTYEFGYAFGLKPGMAPYPSMKNYVLSTTLNFEGEFDSLLAVVYEDGSDFVDELRNEDGGDVYLCGGGVLAASLLKKNLVDRLVLKVNPVVFGRGRPLFAELPEPAAMELESSKAYANGVLLNSYRIVGG